MQAAKRAKSKQPSAQKSSQKKSRKSKGSADADESQGTLFDIVKAGKGALRVRLMFNMTSKLFFNPVKFFLIH